MEKFVLYHNQLQFLDDKQQQLLLIKDVNDQLKKLHFEIYYTKSLSQKHCRNKLCLDSGESHCEIIILILVK